MREIRQQVLDKISGSTEGILSKGLQTFGKHSREMASEMEVADVVIVGAGVSGLTAAYHIKNKDPNLKVIVVEAKDRVGGRTVLEELKTEKGTDVWDLGGQWVGTCQPHVMSLSKELGLETYAQYSDGKKIMQLGDERVRTYTTSYPPLGGLALIDLLRLWSKIETLQRTVPIEDPGQCSNADLFDSMTTEQFIRENGWTKGLRDAVEAAWRVMFGFEPSEGSLLHFLSYANAAGGLGPLTENGPESGQELKLKGGAGQIAQLLADNIGRENIWHGQPVDTVQHDHSGVTICTKGGRKIGCKRIVITTPPHQTVKMNFEPMLPTENLHVFQNMAVGYITKIIITYRKAFWREKGYSGEVVTNGGPALVDGVSTGPLCVCYDATSSNDNPALVGFIGGKQQREYNKLTPELRRKAVIESFVTYFGDEAREYLDYREKDWGLEPYSCGGPVCIGSPGMSTSLPLLRKPLGRIHFAGTESATVWCGFINGAIQTGYRAANEVLYNLRPQILTAADLEGTAYDPKQGQPRAINEEGRGRMLYTVLFLGAVCSIGFIFRKKIMSHL